MNQSLNSYVCGDEASKCETLIISIIDTWFHKKRTQLSVSQCIFVMYCNLSGRQDGVWLSWKPHYVNPTRAFFFLDKIKQDLKKEIKRKKKTFKLNLNDVCSDLQHKRA